MEADGTQQLISADARCMRLLESHARHMRLSEFHACGFTLSRAWSFRRVRVGVPCARVSSNEKECEERHRARNPVRAAFLLGGALYGARMASLSCKRKRGDLCG